MDSQQYARFHQYEYRANSNLVLTGARRTRPSTEATGEVESLVGKIQVSEFGSRARPDKPPKELLERIKKLRGRKRDVDEEEDFTVKKAKFKKEDVLSVTDLYEGYRPKTKETQVAYEALLAFIKRGLGDQPQDVLRDAANEILAILKDASLKEPEKQKQCEELLVEFDQTEFSRLVSIGREISDYADESETVDALDEKHGVALLFEGTSDSESDYEGYIRDDSDDDDDDDDADRRAAGGGGGGGGENTQGDHDGG